MELRIEGSSKAYPNGVRALDKVSLTIPPGMYGLLGPNGAGKSTLMRTIATLQEPDAGQIYLGEIDVLREKQELRKTLGYLPQEFGVYPRTSAQDMLSHLALLKGIVDAKQRKAAVEALLQRTNLWDHRKKVNWIFRRHAATLWDCAGAAGKSTTADRGRAHRRPRSRRAQPFLRPAFRHRRECDRDSFHPHRRRRDGAVHQHGDHSSGQGPLRRIARG